MSDPTNKIDASAFVVDKHEPRLPKAAADYTDALLAVQRERFEREMAAMAGHPSPSTLSLPQSLHMFADSDNFIGAGWSKLDQNNKGISFRWMGRIGSLLLPVDLSVERRLTITGCDYAKKRFLKECTLWIDETPLEFSLSRRGNRWTMKANTPVLPARAYYLLRLQSSGITRLTKQTDSFASLAVSEVKITD